MYTIYLADLELHKTDSVFFVVYRNRIICINELFFNILSEAKKKEINIYEVINTKQFSNYEKILIIEKIDALFLLLKNKNRSNNYIKRTFIILNSNSVNFLSSYLTIFFTNRKLNYLFIFVLFTINILFIATAKTNDSLLNWYESFFLYSFFFLILIIHELGHSSACRSFNLKPQEIGMGFYLFFPILYSNVTRIWLLKKGERILVNLGGIYFQLIIGTLLILFSLTLQCNSFIYSLIKLNFIVIIYSLIPFFRNDGYWIIADYLMIKNLQERSTNFFLNFFKGEKNSKIIIYSILNFIFLIICYVYLILSIQSLYISIVLKEGDLKANILTNLTSNGYKITICVLFIFFTLQQLLKKINTRKNER